MLRYLSIAALFILSLVLQSTVFDFIRIAGVKPDLVLLLVIYFAFTNGPIKGALLGLLLGFLEDLILGHYLGINALALLFAGFVAGWFEERMYKENLLIALLVVFVATALAQLLILGSGIAVGLPWEFKTSSELIVAIAIYNMCLVPFTYPWFYTSMTKGWLRYRPKHEK